MNVVVIAMMMAKKSTVTEWATAAVATLVALAQLRKGKILKCQNSHPLHFNLEKRDAL